MAPLAQVLLLAREEVATAYGVAVLREFSGRSLKGGFPSLNWTWTAPNCGRLLMKKGAFYAFIAFSRRGEGQSAFYVVLEYCGRRFGAFSPRYAGFTSRLADELEDFLAVTGDSSRSFPGECKWWIP